MTDKKDIKGVQTVTRPYRARGVRSVRLLVVALVIMAVLGCQKCPDDGRPASITCQDIVLDVEPGTCVPILNPAREDGLWAGPPDYDGFDLCPTDEQRGLLAAGEIYIMTRRTGHEVTRFLCIGSNSPHFAGEDISFKYSLGRQYGTGSIFLTVSPRFSVGVTATPANIAVGESSQLVATARGGIPPYFYAWIPTTGLNDTDIAAPIATPRITTEYRVRVSDSGGQEVNGSVTITVGMGLTATANPPRIRLGDVSVLLADARGGTPPYTYEWTPADSLDDGHSLNPSATPATTTIYQVTARDSTGTTRQASVTVFVGLDVTVTANPLFINPGEASQLNAVPGGGTPPYTFAWTPAETLDRPHDPNPLARPTTATTYTVVVRDSLGEAAAGSITITPTDGSPPPTASFVFNVTCCPTLNLDASASTGNIVTYTWDLGWTSANPDRITTSPITSFPIREFDRGTITLTVTSASGRTATTTRTF